MDKDFLKNSPWMFFQEKGVVSIVIANPNLPEDQKYFMCPIARSDTSLGVFFAHDTELNTTVNTIHTSLNKEPITLTVDLFLGVFDGASHTVDMVDIDDEIFEPYVNLYKNFFKTSTGRFGEKPRMLKELYLTNEASFNFDVGTYFTLTHSGIQ